MMARLGRRGTTSSTRAPSKQRMSGRSQRRATVPNTRIARRLIEEQWRDPSSGEQRKRSADNNAGHREPQPLADHQPHNLTAYGQCSYICTYIRED